MNSLNIRKQLVALVVGLALLLSLGVTAGTMGVADMEPPVAVVGINSGGAA